MKQKITPKLFVDSYNLDSSILLNLSQFFLNTQAPQIALKSPNGSESIPLPDMTGNELSKQSLPLVSKIFQQVNQE